jgi:hypothetical protein
MRTQLSEKTNQALTAQCETNIGQVFRKPFLKRNKNAFILFLSLLTVTAAQSQVDNCLDFDGVDDYILVENGGNLGTSDFTIEAWIYIESPNLAGSKIINKGLTSFGNPSNAGYSLRATKTAEDDVEFMIGNSDGTIKRLLYNGIMTNAWHHIAGVREQRNLYLYLDGNLVLEDSTQGVFNVTTDIPLSIGAIDRGGNNPVDEFLDGRIDEVRIWNISRTGEEILASKDCAINTPQDGLLLAYNFNETSGGETEDASQNNNTGMLEGDPQWVTSEVAPICIVNTEEKFVLGKINAYPNPSHSIIKLDGLFEGKNFEIIDISGQLIQKGIIRSNEISLIDLARGVYFLRIFDHQKYYLEKITKL